MKTAISNTDDVIDSRDVIERIEELEGEIEALEEAYAEAYEAWEETSDDEEKQANAEKSDKAQEALREWNDDNADELRDLKALAEEAEGYAADWKYGETLIRESHFASYCQELCEDVGYIPKDIPSWIEIDWKATARNMRQDYTSVEFGGVTYLIR